MSHKPATALKNLTLLFLLTLVGVLTPRSVFAARINLSPSTVTLTEGQSQVVTVTLEDPIICPDMDETCNVIISVSTNSEDRMTITDTPITIPYQEWTQSFTFTIAAIDDQLDNGDVTPVITLSTQSNSEYYSNFVPTFTMNIQDNDQAAVQIDEPTNDQSATVDDQPRLPDTGSNQTVAFVLLGIMLAGAVLGALTLRQRRFDT